MVDRDKAHGTGGATPAPGFRPFPEQDDHGVDVSLIRELLKLTPTERVSRGETLRQAALRLQHYGREHRRHAGRAKDRCARTFDGDHARARLMSSGIVA